ncbi:hypothetical protein BU14_1030s0004 [Porphyra umbilicalis]|uniref:Uncharacterized protein n=1 Tax=Porphyra umbilicalis TaxID=2786 RepID=A0A1X6NMQ0_PORUM|nr:hypothetical protein BU14_1030s0004 [Porphyra umbilicalis]|eukprot:OSX69894.1 hypothetical protein BU14_1030s0004 [Porphyra umbilicalis]
MILAPGRASVPPRWGRRRPARVWGRAGPPPAGAPAVDRAARRRGRARCVTAVRAGGRPLCRQGRDRGGAAAPGVPPPPARPPPFDSAHGRAAAAMGPPSTWPPCRRRRRAGAGVTRDLTPPPPQVPTARREWAARSVIAVRGGAASWARPRAGIQAPAARGGGAARAPPPGGAPAARPSTARPPRSPRHERRLFVPSVAPHPGGDGRPAVRRPRPLVRRSGPSPWCGPTQRVRRFDACPTTELGALRSCQVIPPHKL